MTTPTHLHTHTHTHIHHEGEGGGPNNYIRTTNTRKQHKHLIVSLLFVKYICVCHLQALATITHLSQVEEHFAHGGAGLDNQQMRNAKDSLDQANKAKNNKETL